jgi:hypothetical protein
MHPVRLAAVGVGPQRTGSTWLYECLRRHPELCFPRGVKETHFLDERFARGWGWYGAHFAHRRAGQRCMEIASTYFDAPETAQRLQAHAPACRIVVSLRDPAERAFSLWLHERTKGRLRSDFPTALRECPRLLGASRYRAHLERWRGLFGPDRVLVVLLDDIAQAPAATLARVHEFLGVSPAPPPPVAYERVNPASLPALPALARVATVGADRLRASRLYGPIELAKRLGLKQRLYAGARAGVPALDPPMRARLVVELEPDIAYVETLLGRPLPGWRTGGCA